MAEIGSYNSLTVLGISDLGVNLDGGDLGKILLPARQAPEGVSVGDELELFVYFDSDDSLVATALKPKATVGQCEFLRVVDVNNAGAFLDWGLPKDLLLPYSEQQNPVEVGFSCVVYVFREPRSERIAASTKLSNYLLEEVENNDLQAKQPVSLLIAARTELGYKAVVNNKYLALLFRSDAYRPLKIGERLPGFVKTVREDGKIDLLISMSSAAGQMALADRILEHLKANGGESPLSDKADAESIHQTFKVSKKKYKQALGTLYKERKIKIAADKITLLVE